MRISPLSLVSEGGKERKIEFNRCGKYILSSNDQESETLNDIYKNGLACGVNDLVYDSSLNSKYSFLDFKDVCLFQRRHF